jgi:hypothetical protein
MGLRAGAPGLSPVAAHRRRGRAAGRPRGHGGRRGASPRRWGGLPARMACCQRRGSPPQPAAPPPPTAAPVRRLDRGAVGAAGEGRRAPSRPGARRRLRRLPLPPARGPAAAASPGAARRLQATAAQGRPSPAGCEPPTPAGAAREKPAAAPQRRVPPAQPAARSGAKRADRGARLCPPAPRGQWRAAPASAPGATPAAPVRDRHTLDFCFTPHIAAKKVASDR